MYSGTWGRKGSFRWGQRCTVNRGPWWTRTWSWNGSFLARQYAKNREQRLRRGQVFFRSHVNMKTPAVERGESTEGIGVSDNLCFPKLVFYVVTGRWELGSGVSERVSLHHSWGAWVKGFTHPKGTGGGAPWACNFGNKASLTNQNSEKLLNTQKPQVMPCFSWSHQMCVLVSPVVSDSFRPYGL